MIINDQLTGIRQTLLFALFCLGAVGSYMPIVGLHAFRVAILLVTVLAAPLFRGKDHFVSLDYTVLRAFFALGFCWLFFGLLGIYWAHDVNTAQREIVDVFFVIIMAFSVTALVGNSSRVRAAIPWSWVGAYVVTAGVACWEISTGEHLESHYLDNSAFYVIDSVWVKSTFSNPNGYAAFLLMCFPPIVYCGSRLKRGLRAGYFLVGIPSFVLLMFLTGSRGGLVGVLLEGALLAYAAFGIRKVLLLAVGLGAAAFVLFGYLELVFDSSIGVVGKLVNVQASFDEGGSFVERLSLSANGIYMLFDSYALGVGPGQFESRVLMRDMPYFVSVPNPHNFFIEVASQYGIVVIGALCWLLFSTWRFHLRKLRSSSQFADRSFNVMMLASIVGYGIAALESSSYIVQPSNWLFLSTLLASTLHENSASHLSSR